MINRNYNYTQVEYAEWLDKDTFAVHFTPIVYDTINGTTAEIIAEYHNDEEKCIEEIQFFDKDGNFLESRSLMSEVNNAHIFNIVKEITAMKMEKDHSCSFEIIFGKDGFKGHDEFVDHIVNYYSANNDSLAYDVENAVNVAIINLLNKLDSKYKN